MSAARNRVVLVTGAAGFIGSHLTDRLLELGNKVVGIDNFSRGTRGNLKRSQSHPSFHFFERDLSNLDSLREIVSSFEIDTVWHMVANSDIGAGVADPNVDLKDTFLSTFNVLVAMRDAGIRKLAFASTSAVYGVHDQVLEENIGPSECRASFALRFGEMTMPTLSDKTERTCEAFSIKRSGPPPDSKDPAKKRSSIAFKSVSERRASPSI